MTHKRLRILCGEPQNYSRDGLDAVRAFAELEAVELSQAAFEKQVPDFDAVMVRLQLRVTRALIQSAPRLKAILSPTTGLNHIDLDAAEEAGIQVFHLRGETDLLQTITSTAEHTWGLLQALLRKLPSAFDDVKRGQWVQQPHRGYELKGKTLGIVGYGRLGRIVARYAQAFAMHVCVYDPYVTDVPEAIDHVDSLDVLMRRSDIVSIHAPLNETTVGLIGAEALKALAPGAFVVNTARGELIDEDAVLALLKSGHLSGYAADVLANEHKVSVDGHPLITYARAGGNVVLTPHIGGAAWEAIEQTDAFIVQKARRWWEARTASG